MSQGQRRQIEIVMETVPESMGNAPTSIHTMVTERQRVLFDQWTPGIPGAEAAHWRAVLERISFFTLEADAVEAVDASAFEEQGRIIGELERTIQERDEVAMLQTRRIINWTEAYQKMAHECEVLREEATRSHAKKKPAKKLPTKKRARK